jgi:curved DNA-binding protein CbpA
MNYFSKINSLTELKKQYRKLAIENHPDKGGTTEAMQKINAEFEQLFNVWEHDKSVSTAASGYENDYSGASAKEYTEYVYHEYRWTGNNYNGQHPPEVVDIVRKWLKETYPYYRFSVRRHNYNCISVDLLKADFEPYIGIGNDLNPYKLEIPKLKAPRGAVIPSFKHPEGKTHKAIRQALGKEKFALYNTRSNGQVMALGKSCFWEDGTEHFYPLSYSSLKTAQKRIDRLREAGIISKTTGRNGGYIRFIGYTPEAEAGIERERQEWMQAKKAWDEKHAAKEENVTERVERLSSCL